MAILRSLIVSLLARTDNFDQGMRKAEASLRGFRGATVQFQGQIRGLTTELLKFSAAQAGIATALDMVRKGFQTGLNLEQVQQRLLNVTGSAAGARQALLLLEQMARATGFSLTVLAQGFTALQTASQGTSLSFEDVTRIFEQFMRAARAARVQEDQLENIFEELTELINQQTISVTDLVPLLKQFPGIMDAMARSMGVSRAELERMSQSGELLTTVVLPRLAEEMGKTSAQNVTPLTDSVKALTTAWDELWRTIAQSGALEIVTRGIQEVTRAVKDLVSFLKSNESWITKLLRLVPGGDLFAPGAAEAPGTGGLAPGQPRPGDVVPPPDVPTTPTPTAPPEVSAREREVQRLEQEIARRSQDLDALLKRANERMLQFPQSAQTIVEETAAAAEKLIEETAKLVEQLERSLRELEQQGQQLQGQAGKTAAAISPQRAAIRQEIERIAPEYGLDPRLVEAVVQRESAFNPRAVSHAGAQGLMQLMPPTAREMGVTDPFDIEQNLRGGMKYLAQLLKQFNGDMEKALAAYNAGPGRVLQAEKGRPLPPETRAYVPAVQAEYQRLQAEGTGAMDTTAAATTAATAKLQTMQEQIARTRQQLEEMRTAADALVVTQERMAAEDRYIDLLIETQNEVNALTMSEEELARTSLERMQRQAAAARDLRDAMRKDPQGTTAIVSEALAARLEERQSLQATETLDAMRLQQTQSIHEVIGSLRDQEAQLSHTSKGYLQYRLAVLGATEAEIQEASSLHEMIRVMEDVKDIGQTVFDNLAESLSSFVATGKMDFKSLADAIIADLARVALRATITEWGQKLLNLGLNALGTGSTPSSDPAVATLTSIGSLPLTHRQLGGPVLPQHAYLVGEAGPELFLPGRSGTVIANRTLGLKALGGVPSPDVATMDPIGRQPLTYRQLGGPVLPQRAYLVGETGPELFLPGRSGAVMSNRSLQGGEHTTVHLHFPGVTNRQEADAIRRSAGQIGSQMIAALERTRARNHVPNTAR